MSNSLPGTTHGLRHLLVACAMFGLAASAHAATTLETLSLIHI